MDSVCEENCVQDPIVPKLARFWREKAAIFQPMQRGAFMSEACRIFLRTILLTVRFRGPDLIGYVVNHGWTLEADHLAAVLMDFSRNHRVVDDGSEDTRFEHLLRV